jgi:hypothetical protein
MLTPKFGTGKRLTCGSSLEKVPFGKRFSSKHSVKDVCGREYVIIRQRSYFTLGRRSIRECVMTWLEYKEGTN